MLPEARQPFDCSLIRAENFLVVLRMPRMNNITRDGSPARLLIGLLQLHLDVGWSYACCCVARPLPYRVLSWSPTTSAAQALLCVIQCGRRLAPRIPTSVRLSRDTKACLARYYLRLAFGSWNDQARYERNLLGEGTSWSLHSMEVGRPQVRHRGMLPSGKPLHRRLMAWMCSTSVAPQRARPSLYPRWA